jgi:hypothetical protein
MRCTKTKVFNTESSTKITKLTRKRTFYFLFFLSEKCKILIVGAPGIPAPTFGWSKIIVYFWIEI